MPFVNRKGADPHRGATESGCSCWRPGVGSKELSQCCDALFGTFSTIRTGLCPVYLRGSMIRRVATSWRAGPSDTEMLHGSSLLIAAANSCKRLRERMGCRAKLVD